jgi:hypothetical protein
MRFSKSIYCMFLFPVFLAAQIFNSSVQFAEYLTNAEEFYEEYVAEQKNINETVGLGVGTNISPFNPPVLPNPPTNPPAPTPEAGYLPFVIVNNSGIPDSSVYITIIGAQISGTTASTQKMYVTFAPSNTGIGSYVYVPNSGSGSITPVPLTSLHVESAPSHTYSFYIPAQSLSPNASDGISGARIYFQMNDSTHLITYDSGALTEPSVTNQSLAPYSIFFDKFEFAYVPLGSPKIAADATAVDFFSIPLYGFLSTPDAGSPGNSGLYQSQSFIMQNVVPAFFNNRCTNAAILAQWNQLFAPSKTNLVRVLSPSTAMSVGTASTFPNKFDPNYFDNEAAYGFSLLKYLWYSTHSFYRQNGLYFQVPASSLYPQPGTCSANNATGVYTATINADNTIGLCPVFTTESQSYFPAPSTASASAPTPSGPTSYQIFAAQNLNPTFASNLQGNQVSKLFEEAMIAGLLPASFSPSNPLSNSYLSANSGNYYKNRTSLPESAGGPWYSVYSEALHYCGSIYAFGFDEPLYPNVLMQSSAPTSSTYIGITIGTCDLVP